MADLLVVDDDSDMAELLATVLRHDGHEVRIAHDGAEGLRLLQRRAADVVLLDVEMPVLTGPAMAKAMLGDIGLETIPLILVSSALDLRAIANAVGTPYYLTKPYGLESLTSLLATALANPKPAHPAVTGMRRESQRCS